MDERLPQEEKLPQEYGSNILLQEDAALREETVPLEYSVPQNEYNENVSGESGGEDVKAFDHHRTVKQLFLKPVAAVLVTVTVVFASFGIDPLGLDIFGESGRYFPEYVRHLLEELRYSSGREPYYEPYPGDGFETGYVNGTDLYPVLTNTEPDFEGNYSWADIGPEYYIRMIDEGGTGYRYVIRGEAWESDDDGSGAPGGVAYDEETNTLTLTNYTGEVLDVNLMGNGFTVCLAGDNYLNNILIYGAEYGGSVRFTGDGSLTVRGENGRVNTFGISLNAEFSDTCLMVDPGVTLDVYGYPAIQVIATSLDCGIYFLDPEVLRGGVPGAYDFKYFEFPEDGPKSSQEAADIYGYEGTFTDYTVLDSADGSRFSTHVRFGS